VRKYDNIPQGWGGTRVYNNRIYPRTSREQSTTGITLGELRLRTYKLVALKATQYDSKHHTTPLKSGIYPFNKASTFPFEKSSEPHSSINIVVAVARLAPTYTSNNQRHQWTSAATRTFLKRECTRPRFF